VILKSGFLVATHQDRKLWTALGLWILFGIGAWVIPGLQSSYVGFFIDLGMMFCFVGSFIWACVAVRCPHCGAKILWMAISSKPLGQWMEWQSKLQSCPRCGFAPPT